MTRHRPCPAAPGPLEAYAARFDDLFSRLAQRRGVREYLAGLLAPRDRNKTLTGVAGAGAGAGASVPGCVAQRARKKTLPARAGAEPVTGAQHRAVQRLQFFLSESRWD